MKNTIVTCAKRLALVACIVVAQLNCAWLGGEAMAMGPSGRRAPFHQSGILPTVWERPAWRTLAGFPDAAGATDAPGISARFSDLAGVAVDRQGSIYLTDSGNYVIRKISPAGQVTTLAGTTGESGWQDGPAAGARFTRPAALALDSVGNLYVGEEYVVRKVTPAGLVTTLAGRFGAGGYRDGNGTNALFGYLGGIALDREGNLYVSDCGNFVIRKVSPTGGVSTLAGRPGISGYQDGTGTNALFMYSLEGLVLDADGLLYVADSGNSVIRRISPAGQVTTWVGQPGRSGYRDGDGTNAWFAGPKGLAIDSQGNVYLTETENRCIRKISPEGRVTTLGGDAWISVSPLHCDGRGPFALFTWPQAIALDGSGHLLVGDRTALRYGSLGPDPQPIIRSQPRSRTVVEGAELTLSVVAECTTPLTYQWLLNGEVLTGATSSSLRLETVQETDAGDYRVAISAGVGYVLSSVAALQVQQPGATSRTPLDNWRPISSLALRDIHGLARGNGRFVAIGGGYEGGWGAPSELRGVVAISEDGEHWMKQLPVTSESLNGVAFGNGRFVAVGNNGTVLTSTHGVVWETQTLTPEGRPDLRGIAFDQGLFVAVSGNANGSIWTSPDGINWTNRGMDFGVSFMAVTAEGGQFIAVGNTIVVSTNGLDWEPAEVPANLVGEEIVLEHIAYASGRFLAAQQWGGFLAASLDGWEWCDAAPTNTLSLYRVVGGEGRFVALDGNSGGISVSTDGTAWTSPVVIECDGQTCLWPHICFEDGLFVATGEDGRFFTSSDGRSWVFHQQERSFPFQLSKTVYAAGRYYAAGGYSGIATSMNLSDWEWSPTPHYPVCLAADGTTLVAAGPDESIFSSQDGGVTWKDRSPHMDYGSKRPYLSQMVFGGGAYVAIGTLQETNWVNRAHILSSTNLLHWVATDYAPTNSMSDIVYGGGCFIALLNGEGNRGNILSSTNGFSWRTAATFSNFRLNTVAYGRGTFVVGTSTGGVITSSDGLTWNYRGVTGRSYFSSIVFGNGLFLASADEGLWSSVHGVAWMHCDAPSVSYYQSIGVGEGTFFAIGDDFVLYQSGPFERLGDPLWVPNLGLEWTVTGAPRIDYRIEFSEDLLNWQTLTRVTNAPARRSFTDPEAVARPSRFYRVVTE
jgi:sugar lactone lactonase YvrE